MKISNESKVGVFAAIAITLLILGYNFLRGKDIFTRTNTFYVVYDDGDGINTSTPVMVNGYKVGQVTSIEPVPGEDFRVRVEMEVRKDIAVKKNDSAKVYEAGLLSGNAIKIVISKKGDLAIDGDVLVAGVDPSLVNNINKTITPIKEKVQSIMNSLDSLLGGESGENLRSSIASLKKITANIQQMTSENSDAMMNVNEVLANVKAFSVTLKNNTDKINNTLKNVSAFSDTLATIKLSEVVNNLNSTVSSLNTFMDSLNNGDGSISKLMRDKGLYDNLNNSAASLDALLKDLQKNPKRYVHFSLFGRKEKAPKKK